MHTRGKYILSRAHDPFWRDLSFRRATADYASKHLHAYLILGKPLESARIQEYLALIMHGDQQFDSTFAILRQETYKTSYTAAAKLL